MYSDHAQAVPLMWIMAVVYSLQAEEAKRRQEREEEDKLR